MIKFYDSFIENDYIYIVMEYAEGGSLDQLIQEKIFSKSSFDTEDILSYVCQICLGLLVMHDKKIIHRDIKS